VENGQLHQQKRPKQQKKQTQKATPKKNLVIPKNP
jgi:hypothetical protein